MRQLRLHKKLYYISKIDETDYSPIAYERKEKLELFDRIIQEECRKNKDQFPLNFMRK